MTNHSHSKLIDSLIAKSSSTLDLTNEEDLREVQQLADVFYSEIPSLDALRAVESELADQKDETPLMIHLAVKLAVSKRFVSTIEDENKVSVVFAMYKEHNRIRQKSEHPHGEDFLLKKVTQLNWLFADQSNFSWELIAVDDGCPEESGKIASEIVNQHGLEKQVKILFLEEAIREKLSVTHPMTSTRESQKGGSIQYGMLKAAHENRPNHVIVFTDADLSTHLGQTGLLLEGILTHVKDSAIGSRREPTSIVLKKGVRNTRGKLFIYLWKRIIPELNYIVDTQCGFKAFRAETIRQIVDDLIEKKFAFDIELLLKTELSKSNSITKIPIAWIDSEAASTTTDIGPYLSMLKATVKMYQKYLPENAESSDFAALIESLDEDSWQRLVDNIPEEIVSREAAEFGTFNGVSVARLREALLEGS